MEKWILYALLSMVFAGFTSVLAKIGLKEVSSDIGLTVRTAFVFLFVAFNAFVFQQPKEFQMLSKRSIFFLVVSALTTTLSWIFYYRAMKEGEVSYVASIDKASIIITLLLSFIFLGEPFSWKVVLGASFILVGLLVLVIK
jgi:transporter family protein